MTFHIRQAAPADQPHWDTYVLQHPHALLAHQFAWFYLLQKTFHIRPVYWLAEKNGRVVGIAPFFHRSHVGLGSRLTSMPYLNTGGILADDAEIRDSLWQAVSQWAVTNGINTIELRSRYEPLPQFIVREGRSVSVIPLPDFESAAWDKLRSTARNRIRKAENADLRVQHGFEYLNRFWPVYAENMSLLGAPVLAKKFFFVLSQTSSLQPHLIVLEQQGKVVAGMVLTRFKDGAENGWTASTEAARALYANDLLYWEAVRWAVSKNLRWLDLGRSEAGSGHERFKEKFNATSTPLPYQEIHWSGGQWQAVTEEPEKLYTAFRTVWKKLPVSLAAKMGPYVSRQIY